MMSCSSLVIGRYCNSSPVWMRGHVGESRQQSAHSSDSGDVVAVTRDWGDRGIMNSDDSEEEIEWTRANNRKGSKKPQESKTITSPLASKSPLTPCFGSLYVTSLRTSTSLFCRNLVASRDFSYFFKVEFIWMFSTFWRDTFIHLPIQWVATFIMVELYDARNFIQYKRLSLSNFVALYIGWILWKILTLDYTTKNHFWRT